MKTLVVALIILFPAISYAGPLTCSIWASLVQATAVDRDNRVPPEQELVTFNNLLSSVGQLDAQNLNAGRIMIRSIYANPSVSPSNAEMIFLNECEREKEKEKK